MRRIYLYFLFALLSVSSISVDGESCLLPVEIDESMAESHLYEELGLERWICYEAFRQGMLGTRLIERKNKDILTLIDFSKPSTAERMVVLDLHQRKVLYASVVSHGRNSGGNYATSFSNKTGSYKSSLGFFLTENTYQGRNGYSLVLDGLEKGINDLAKQRAIVIHGAAYSNPSVAAASGRLGRSLGCPALPESISKSVINTIKEGTLLFIYAKDADYLSQSVILSSEKKIEKMHKKVS